MTTINIKNVITTLIHVSILLMKFQPRRPNIPDCIRLYVSVTVSPSVTTNPPTSCYWLKPFLSGCNQKMFVIRHNKQIFTPILSDVAAADVIYMHHDLRATA